MLVLLRSLGPLLLMQLPLLKNDLWYDPHWRPAKLRPTGILLCGNILTSDNSAYSTVCKCDFLTFQNATFTVSLPDLPADDLCLWAKEDDRSGTQADIMWPNRFGELIKVLIRIKRDLQRCGSRPSLLWNRSPQTLSFSVHLPQPPRWNLLG